MKTKASERGLLVFILTGRFGPPTDGWNGEFTLSLPKWIPPPPPSFWDLKPFVMKGLGFYYKLRIYTFARYLHAQNPRARLCKAYLPVRRVVRFLPEHVSLGVVRFRRYLRAIWDEWITFVAGIGIVKNPLFYYLISLNDYESTIRNVSACLNSENVKSR